MNNALIDTESTRFRIVKTLVDSRKMLTLADLSRKLRIPQQKIAYHLPILLDSGIILRDGTKYFCQPCLLDDDLKMFCATKISEIVESFSNMEDQILAEEEDRNKVVTGVLHALLLIVLPDDD